MDIKGTLMKEIPVSLTAPLWLYIFGVIVAIICVIA